MTWVAKSHTISLIRKGTNILKNNSKKAFTMAEILLVLGIIGVVAAISLPKLSDNVDEQALVAATRKINTELEDAHQAMVARYGEPDSWLKSKDAKTNSQTYAQKLKSFLEVDNDCGQSAGSCMPQSYTDAYYLKLKSGAGLAFYIYSIPDLTCSTSGNKFYPCVFGNIYVDVNGYEKGPNQNGFDIFRFDVSANGVEPVGLSETVGVVLNNSNRETNTAWVIKTGNEDYNKCFSGLSWSGKRTCN